MSLAGVLDRIAAAAERAGRNPAEVKLVVVSKGRSIGEIRERVLAFGHFPLGESRVQEALPKIEALPEVSFHFIGPLQRNKAKWMGHFALVHSLESARVAQALSRRATGVQPVLIEVNVAREPQKHGVLPEDLPELVARVRDLPRLELLGLMTVAPRVDNPEEVRWVFKTLSLLADRFRLPERSMGMSDDFEVAVEEGATLVRVGRAVFEVDHGA